jgi:predicted HTH transcriptional regulator
MAEGQIIQAEDLILESDGERRRPVEGGSPPAAVREATGAGTERDHDFGSLNPHMPDASPLQLTTRQLRAYRHILENGSITRHEYQTLIGGGLPPRTAIYDLHDLVRKGVIKKEGKGPATRYLLAQSISSHPSPKSNGV